MGMFPESDQKILPSPSAVHIKYIGCQILSEIWHRHLASQYRDYKHDKCIKILTKLELHVKASMMGVVIKILHSIVTLFYTHNVL